MTSYLLSTYRRVRFGDALVVVSGLPRSGTSMTMQMLEAGGLSIATDGIRTPGEDNPKGYYEYERVKELDKGLDPSWLKEFRGKAIKIISFLLKDLPETNNYKVVFMRRNIHEVLASQAKMLANRGEANETSDEKMLELYKDHLWKVDYLMKRRPCFELLNVEYKDVIENPRREAERLGEFLGNHVDVEKMAAAVDEKLYRNRR
ncbi:MAG: sulfotransferase domain-containing protein [Vicinamibacteria bacterium]